MFRSFQPDPFIFNIFKKRSNGVFVIPVIPGINERCYDFSCFKFQIIKLIHKLSFYVE